MPERIVAGEFTLRLKPNAKTSKNPKHPQNTKSQHVWIDDKDGMEVASAHYYVCPTGPVSDLDPKTMMVEGIRYTIHPDRLTANPEHRLPFVWMRKVYGWVRRTIICPIFGPLGPVTAFLA